MFGYLISVTGIDFYNFLSPISSYLQCSYSLHQEDISNA